jgi:hypothetical protein
VEGNRIDHRTTRVANEVGHIATFLDHEAAVAVRTGGDFVRDDQVTPFVLVHEDRVLPEMSGLCV